MSVKMHSATLICMTDDRDTVDRISCALGYAPYDSDAAAPADSTVTVPLSASGARPESHYGAHIRSDDSFIELFSLGADGVVPVSPRSDYSWADFGIDRASVAQVIPRLTLGIERNTFAPASWQPALDELGLQRVVGDE